MLTKCVNRARCIYSTLRCNVLGYNQYENKARSTYAISKLKFHTTGMRNDLTEFFDDEKNWGESEIKVGRSWKKEELRIKSNTDLHKLWFVLLKEKNMLLTMKHEYDDKCIQFPNPERIDKVEESMENLEDVVRERNRAFHELETGEHGERPVVETTNCFGLPYKHKMYQHVIERKYNTKYKKEWNLRNKISNHKDVNLFLMLYNEKKKKKDHFHKLMTERHVCNLLRRFPNMDMEALQAEFPDVDIEKAKNDKFSRGHHLHNTS